LVAAVPVLTPQVIEFLNGRHVAHLATVDGNRRPHVVPVCFALLRDAVYIAIDEKPKQVEARSLRRIRNILANPAACLVADRYDDAWLKLAWVQLHGRACLVSDLDERADGIGALRERYVQYRSMDLESRVLVRLAPERVNVWSIDGSL
jgi:PPOX class probable F420-dependent enzyme